MNNRTAYEMVALHPDGRKYLFGYSVARSRDALIRALRKHGQAAADFFGAEEFTCLTPASQGISLGRWRICFSGRTRLEARGVGELVYWKEARL